ncbi:MAG: rhamnogalacturonan lyase [Tepidisphaeraceae bacterium]
MMRITGDGAPVKLNDKPLTGPTCFVDEKADLTKPNTYSVEAAGPGATAFPGKPFTLAANPKPYLSIPLHIPAGYHANDASAADLDGDGALDLVVKFENGAQDNSHSGVTQPVLLQGIKLDGTKLWEINLGKNIRGGAHYTQFMVFDFDGDGRAEVACKTAPGTIDGAGKNVILGSDDPKASYVGEDGRVNKGPEYLTIFSGQSGAAIDTVPYVPLRGIDKYDATGDEMKALWGDGYGNRSERYLACVAYLDGVHPSLVMCRGYYTRTFLVAWDLVDGKLKQRWVFDGDKEPKGYNGQGNHNLSVADVDGDGKDEIIYGGMVVDDNGHGLFTTGYGHGDAIHVGDLDPDNPGLEEVRIQERFDKQGLHMVALKTGKTLWAIPSTKAATTGGDKGEGPGRGASFDIDPRHPGSESWAFGAGMTGLYDAKGNRISDKAPRSCNMRIYWDGDELDELLDGTFVSKWNWEKETTDPIFDAKNFDCVKINGTKSNPSLSADLFGDWREELVYPTADDKELRVFTTPIPTQRRMYTLMHDPVYRLGVAWENVAYNQPPHVGFLVGPNMPEPPRPNITLIRAK